MLRLYEDLFFSAVLGSFASAQRYGREENMCYILTCVEDHKTRIYTFGKFWGSKIFGGPVRVYGSHMRKPGPAHIPARAGINLSPRVLA
jgi:hypothetical protein